MNDDTIKYMVASQILNALIISNCEYGEWDETLNGSVSKRLTKQAVDYADDLMEAIKSE